MVNQGGGAFAKPLLYPAGEDTLALTAADFNADGALDLAAIDYALGNLNVLLNEGHGSFAAPVPYAADGPGDFSLIAADVNGDLAPDLVTFSSTRVTVLKNLGNAGFAAPVNYAVGAYNAAIAAVDLNRDGHVDLVVSDPPNGVVNVLVNDGAGVFAPPVSYPAGPDPFNVTATDINSDGWPDLVIGHTEYIHDYVAVLLNERDGTLGPPIRYRAGSTATTAIATADINRDGRPDLIAVNNDRDQVSVLQTACLR